MSRLSCIAIVTLGWAACAMPALAQSVSLPLALSLEVLPASPSPGQNATVRAITPTLDTATTFFDWSIDGARKPELSGYGNRSIQVTAGGVGTSIRAAVTVTGAAWQPAQSAISVYPSTVALAWHAQTYTPAWYKGKALPTPNAVVVVTATPHIVLSGETIKPENLIYTWGFENRDRLLAGVGKRSFAVQMSDQTDVDQQVRVAVEDIDRRIRKEGSIFITTAAPRAIIYHLTPLGGIDPRITASALGAFGHFKHEAIDLQVEPFFFPARAKKDLQFQWTIGGLTLQGNPQNPFIATIEASDPQLENLAVSAGVSQPQPNNLVARAFASLLLFFK